MEIRIKRKKFLVFAFDIESHNDEESIAKRETSMWLGSFIDEESKVEDESSYFYNMDSFIDHLEFLTTRKRKNPREKRPINNICIYIYNTSFEWSFILPVLLKRGFKYEEDVVSDKTYNSISTRSVSSVWEIRLRFSKDGGLVIIRDLAKIYGGGLRKVAKAFNLPTQKGDIDYRLNRLHGHVVTKEEKEYCFKDTRIIIDILLEMQRRGDKNFFQSISMASYSMKMMIKEGYKRKTRPYQAFRKEYPQLGKEESEFLRKSVSGGICYAPTRWQFKDIHEPIIHIDAHSMHPSSAYLHNFPYGVGEYHRGKPKDYLNKINCCHVKISYDGVKLHSVIKLIGIDFTEDCDLYLWDFEIETLKKAYINLEIEYIDYYAYSYKILPWRKYYKNCFEERKKAKARGDNFNYLYYKLLINSSYGKLLENPHLERFENIVDESGIITSVVQEKDLKGDDSDFNAKYTYLPVGSCIPAYSRCCLIELALKIGWESVVYFDTDSIFFLDTPTTRENMNKYMNASNDLGGWAIEEIIERAQFTAPKRYKTLVEGKPTFKMGGFNLDSLKRERAKENNIEIHDIVDLEKIEIDFDAVNICNATYEVQSAFRCKGGTIIDYQKKEVSIQDKYKDIYIRNTTGAK